MKRLFVLLSTVIMTVFFVWVVVERAPQLRYASYPSVTVLGKLDRKESSSRESFESALTSLAKRKDSLIARRIAEPHKSGKANFTYVTYGNGDLPKELPQASSVSAEQSDLANSYLVVKGALTKKELLSEIHKQGYQAVDYGSQSNPITFFVTSLSKGAQLLALLIFLLTFAALTLIYRVRSLRSAGIRLISGQSMLEIMVTTTKVDLVQILQAYVLSALLGAGLLVILGLLEFHFIVLVLSATLFYILLLFLLSFLLTLVYLLSLKSTRLIEIIKGKLPLRRLIIFMLLGQFLAVVVVGNSISRISTYSHEWKEQSLASHSWEREGNWVNLGFNISGFQENNSKEQERRTTIWYHLIEEGVAHQETMLVQHNFANYMMSSQTMGGTKLTDYAPEGNTLYVTPNYFTNQDITLPAATVEQLAQLKEGEFALILPQKLSKQSQYYANLYENYFSKTLTGLKKAQALVSYLPDDRSYFVFNQTPIASQQYLVSPIFLVLTPISTGSGKQAKAFWNNALSYYLFFDDYDKTLALLKQYGTYPWISYVESSQGQYYKQLNNIRSEVFSTVAGSVLGIATSILLFNAMNLLYFEQFRRLIFIKRISGMSFMSIHRNYLLSQLLVLLLGFATVVFMSHRFLISFLSLVIFISCALAVLLWQLSAENRLAVTVLKGK